ncbi:hypothetical protein DACRYDRAFT_24882 [Dacryopinax primogenitus]|uniref:Uncharacterized protein n=1 Tax=Dacryopinax primogenitus (strain DJM 731) TaxID=1858805 RepID=M5G2I0_DACPD|nr:uncharacterized protein DACRYDRAFT_24882 [Dacryopinax primogenitus]EJT97972.1 hypothetical protein DACRYDRAFT_24882 [Dacryopinax primogenitus]
MTILLLLPLLLVFLLVLTPRVTPTRAQIPQLPDLNSRSVMLDATRHRLETLFLTEPVPHSRIR